MSNVADLIARHEGKTLEFKRDLSSPDGVIKTIVAFANGAGGTLLLGIEDRTRRVCGISEPTRAEEQLANLISNRIEPRVLPELSIVPWRKTYVVVVGVFPSASRPHFVKSLGLERGVFVRIGSTSRRADSSQIEEMARLARGRSFDEEPLPDANTEAIDFRAASECFAPVRTLRARDLGTLGMTTAYHGRNVPTTGGVLLFGRERARHFPDAHLRAGCFAGTDRTTIIDSVDLDTHLPLTPEPALHFVKRNTRRALTVEGVHHAETWEVPLVAVREAIINALVHADYALRGAPLRVAIFDDRLEVENPGGLPPGLTVEDIVGGVSKLRNRVIGRVFHELRLIEQWGSGIQRMIAACRRAGLPDPVFEEIGTSFRVTLLRGTRPTPALDPLDQAIVDFVHGSTGASTAQIAAHIRRTPRATRSRLGRLESDGRLVAVGSGPRDPRRLYVAPRDGRFSPPKP